jgi:hypothetical protein
MGKTQPSLQRTRLIRSESTFAIIDDNGAKRLIITVAGYDDSTYPHYVLLTVRHFLEWLCKVAQRLTRP